jgi:hypothetical protein
MRTLNIHYAVVKNTNDYNAPDGISFVKERADGKDDVPGEERRPGSFDWIVIKPPYERYAHWVTLGADGAGMEAVEANMEAVEANMEKKDG